MEIFLLCFLKTFIFASITWALKLLKFKVNMNLLSVAAKKTFLKAGHFYFRRKKDLATQSI